MSDIKTIISQTISTKEYDLAPLLETIDYYHIQGSLTTEDREELIQAAKDSAPTQLDMEGEIVKLWQAVYALQDKLSGTTQEEYPPYDPDRLYMSGDKVTFEGVKYVCAVKEGKATKFSPADKPKDWTQVEA